LLILPVKLFVASKLLSTGETDPPVNVLKIRPHLFLYFNSKNMKKDDKKNKKTRGEIA